ncbi:MAG: peptidylprolyl isomerase [Saprospiraceae bacterium]
MKRLIFYKITVLLITTVALNAQQFRAIDKIIAKVGSEIVLYSDWQEQIAYIKDKQNFLSNNDDCAILENLLVQKFMVHQAKLDSIEIKDEEVESQLNARIDQIMQYMGNDNAKFEEYYGQSVNEVRKRFRDDLKAQILTEKLQNKIVGSVTITPKEAEKFYKSIPKDSLPYLSSEVEIAEIVVRPKPSTEETDHAREKLRKLQQRIRAGEDFGKLAGIYSDDLGSGKQGGQLGWTKRGTLVPEFEAVAYKLEQDSISDIVESDYGFHIIQLLGRRGNNINTRHILIKPEITEKELEQARASLREIRKKINADTIPFEQQVRKYSDKKSDTYNFGGQLVNQKTSNSYFEIADLEPDVYFAIDKLKVGEISDVIESKDPEGKKYFRILKLVSRSAPHKANLRQDYAKIQQAAKDLKKNEIFRDWLNSHAPKIYSEVDPEIVAQCPNLSIWVHKKSMD